MQQFTDTDLLEVVRGTAPEQLQNEVNTAVKTDATLRSRMLELRALHSVGVSLASKQRQASAAAAQALLPKLRSSAIQRPSFAESISEFIRSRPHVALVAASLFVGCMLYWTTSEFRQDAPVQQAAVVTPQPDTQLAECVLEVREGASDSFGLPTRYASLSQGLREASPSATLRIQSPGKLTGVTIDTPVTLIAGPNGVRLGSG